MLHGGLGFAKAILIKDLDNLFSFSKAIQDFTHITLCPFTACTAQTKQVGKSTGQNIDTSYRKDIKEDGF